MHALMGKSSKAPTTQELYKARKQKEEDERNAFLPPGLINHGNTCFMNSVLQGLIATPMLADIVLFSLPETYAPISSRRSPQLTNGHGLGGDVEREWEKGMPLGDTFIQLMQRAWKIQDERQRQSMSPRELLQRIGYKFDQYLDFRQQDAHEFLRHLLDAIRMEELDIIKERQPPTPKAKGRRRSKTKDSDVSSPPASTSEIPEDERLVSFVDMVFGGRLASILVCEKCKKISWTYEDFNDLSLSIKQEDYEKSRKRHRLKSLARKLGMRGRNQTRELEIPDGPRSSSVPSSPLRRSEEGERSFELVLGDVGHRRRSLEAGEETPSITTTFREESSLEDAEVKTKDDRRMLSVPGEQNPPEEDDQPKEDSKREKDEDGWIKLRRKISVGVGVKKPHKKKRVEALPDLPSNDESQTEATTGDEALDSFVDVKAPTPIPASPSLSPLLGASIALQKFSFVRRPSSTRTGTRNNSTAPSIVASPSRSPDIPSVPLPPPQGTRPSSPPPAPAPAPVVELVRPKSPRPPKPTRSESAYLRRLLADIPPSSSSSTSVPFNLFRTGPVASSTLDMSDIRGAWSKLGHVQSVEGCLRMFTSVEVLEGENMVGCRSCWKIQHGEYVPREKRPQGDKEEAGEEAEEENADEGDEYEDDEVGSSSSASIKINLVDSGGLPPKERLARSTSPLSSSMELSERISVHSAPPAGSHNAQSFTRHDSRDVATLNSGTSSSPALSVPSISMTTVESTPSAASERTPTGEISHNESSIWLHSSPSRDSLQLPPATRHFRQSAERSSRLSITGDTSSLSSDDSGDEAEETETSMRSDSSSIASTHLEPPGLSRTTTLVNSSADPSLLNNSKVRKSGGKGKDTPRSKQVIMRRAYKRYLIATPPPVLVVHLKRFQQVGRSPTQLQFFTNFKKLDDPVSFPEYLDLSPFLLPSKNEMSSKVDKRKRKSNEEKEKSEKDVGAKGCMYRLYAVVVHIGNMLGGHYVAYTALPEAARPPTPYKDKEKDTSSSSLSSQTTSDSIRPEIPRTTSFSRTATPHSHPSSKSRTSSSSGPGGGTQRQWCYVSDTIVRLATLEEVLQAKAYICMYERI